jgi:hypothetical protein
MAPRSKSKPSQRVVFVGIGRSETKKNLWTRKNMAKLIGVSFEDGTFDRLFAWRNLYEDQSVGKTDPEDDRLEAERLRTELLKFDRIVLLGDVVAKAFGVAARDKYKWFDFSGSVSAARMIHTSQFIRHMPRHREEFNQAGRFARTLLHYT